MYMTADMITKIFPIGRYSAEMWCKIKGLIASRSKK